MPTRSYAYDLSWSPDERFFAYVSTGTRRSVSTRLWVVSAVGGKSFPATEPKTSDWSPTWSPDSRTLYYISTRGGTMDLWQQRLAGDGAPFGDPEPLTTGIGMRRAAFSPSGDRLAYVKGAWVANLWRVPILPDRPASWADAEQLTFERNFIRHVTVSPDGQSVALVSDRSGTDNVWRVHRGGELQPFTTDALGVSTVDWSPDGAWLAYVAYRPATGPRLVKTPVGGGDPVPITDLQVWNYVWADSGDIYFTPFTGSEAGNVWAVSAEGDDSRALTDLTGRQGTLGGEALDTDGEYIYFTWEEDVGDIWLMGVVQASAHK